MRRRLTTILIVAAALLTVIGAAMAFMLMRREPEWSSRSPLAVREFNAGLEAERKFYFNEAKGHFERAVGLDPEFTMARLKLAERTNPKFEELKALIERTDASRLNERERFLIAYAKAMFSGKPENAEAVLDRYLKKNPDDAFALSRLCSRRWDSRDLARAEECYKRLIQVDPNWVSAQNNLGYIAMAQGRFAEAEELFRTYRYIAPDQANPHDSLGELFTLVGRYEDAEKELHQALKVRPDFCASWDHLMTVAILQGDADKAREILQSSQKAGCSAELFDAGNCSVDAFEHFTSKEWDQTVDAALSEECIKKSPAVMLVAFAAALKSGRKEDADLIEKTYRDLRQRLYVPFGRQGEDPTLLHFEGLRLAFENKDEAAIEKLRAADKELVFWGDGQGIMKLYNRMTLARALEGAGRKAEAQKLMAEVRAVNPHIAETMTVPQF